MKIALLSKVLLTFALAQLVSVNATVRDGKAETSIDPTITRGRHCEALETKIICQNDIPFTICRSGDYELGQNIKWDGPGAAITIKASKVKLHLRDFSICLTNPAGTGIFAHDVHEIAIDSDAIRNISSEPQLGAGIHFLNVTKGKISNILTINHLNGLFIQDSNDITITACNLQKATNAGALVVGSTNVVFTDSVMVDNLYGIDFGFITDDKKIKQNNEVHLNKDCQVINCLFPNSRSTNLLAEQLNGLIIEGCEFSNTGLDNQANLLQLGGINENFPSDLQKCNDAIVKKCTFRNRSANKAPEGIALFNGSGYLIDVCIVDIDNTGTDPDADLSGIHISPDIEGFSASNCLIRGCVVQGPATNGFYPDEGAFSVVIEDCLVQEALKHGIFLAGTSKSTVQNNTIHSNGQDGIFLEESSSNAILNNVIDNNGTNGIELDDDSDDNVIEYNKIFKNANTGISDTGNNNQIFYNTAYANPGGNYPAGTITNTPGNPTKSGENILP